MALEIYWTPTALAGLDTVLEYLEKKWTEKEISKLETKLSALLKQIRLHPQLFPKTNQLINVHKAVVDKNNYLIYRWDPTKEIIEILYFRGTKQKPLF